MIEVVGYDSTTGKLRLSDGSTMTQAELAEKIAEQSEGNPEVTPITVPANFFGYDVNGVERWPRVNSVSDQYIIRFKTQAIAEYYNFSQACTYLTAEAFGINPGIVSGYRYAIFLLPYKRVWNNDISNTVSQFSYEANNTTFIPVLLSNRSNSHSAIRRTHARAFTATPDQVGLQSSWIEYGGEDSDTSTTSVYSLAITASDSVDDTYDLWGASVYIEDIISAMSDQGSTTLYIYNIPSPVTWGGTYTYSTPYLTRSGNTLYINQSNRTWGYPAGCEIEYISDDIPAYWPGSVGDMITYLNGGARGNEWNKEDYPDPGEFLLIDDYTTHWHIYVNGDKINLTYKCDGVDEDNVSECKVGVYLMNNDDPAELFTLGEIPYKWLKRSYSLNDLISRANGDNTSTSGQALKGTATLVFVVFTNGGVGLKMYATIRGQYVAGEYEREVIDVGYVDSTDTLVSGGTDSYTHTTGDSIDTTYDSDPIIYRPDGTSGSTNDNTPTPDADDIDTTGNATRDGITAGSGGFQITRLSLSSVSSIVEDLYDPNWWEAVGNNMLAANPLDCVLSLKSIPFNATGESTSVLPMGYRPWSGSFEKVTKFTQVYTIGSITVPAIDEDFSDYEKEYSIYLPYCGSKTLNAADIVARTLQVKYAVDFMSGRCRAMLFIGGAYLDSMDGDCSISVPLNTFYSGSMDISNAFNKGMAAQVGKVPALGGVLGTFLEDPKNDAFSLDGTYAGNLSHNMPNTCMLLIRYKTKAEASDYAARHGRPCKMTLSLSSLSGYTRINNAEVNPVGATESEINEIKRLLAEGIYL